MVGILKRIIGHVYEDKKMRCCRWIPFPLGMIGAFLVFISAVCRQTGLELSVQISMGCTGLGIITFSFILTIVMKLTSETVVMKASIHTLELYRCAFHTLPI